MSAKAFLSEIDREYQRALDAGSPDQFISRFGFSVPTHDALVAIAAHSPHGVIEIGAGTGAWSRSLADHGVPVIATDPFPAPSPDNEWFAGSHPHCELTAVDHTVVSEHSDRTMLVSWPTRTRTWPYESLVLHHAAGGRCVAYVGEPVGGRTGDDVFQRLLGELTRCRQCDDGDESAPCVCAFKALWRHESSVTIPQLPTHHDELRLYRRRARRRWLS